MTAVIDTQWDLDEHVRNLQALFDAEGLTGDVALLAADIKEAGFRVELRNDKVWVAPHAALPEGEERRAERPTGFEIEVDE